MDRFTKRQSDNGHLWYVEDEAGKIVFVSMFNELAAVAYILARNIK